MMEGVCIKMPKDVYVGCLLRNQRTRALYRVVSPRNPTTEAFGFERVSVEGNLQFGDELVFIADDKPKKKRKKREHF